ncbi:NAD-dependent epimerase/dehydratase family protein [Laribacter hongkongensis]|uniref:NAD-dependent epimerase/dehydratase family protein n=1 Tax=Laribacter hongkongensis TaxID=168471 RepID=UPI000B599437|nr:NAD-dependent epimerase/dehydratase family protein [Laribacter hongkongensis]MCG9087441.1 NAD-dependent epimerase/dehydratase family protein [Laribacter hongkongensis]MCG9109485.1 NAD-dependent epimerase/dehydratase family protein [Laribacter hongkongensis]MCG9120383.1 NAD-dependent epimerase/dehydratase family protein [Laribacter hongkongensis]
MRWIICLTKSASILFLTRCRISWKAALDGCCSVVHLAARTHVMSDQEIDPLKAFRAHNVDLTLELATRAIDAGVRRFVFMSTVKVNGEETSSGCTFTPDDPPSPKDPYSISKYEAEQGLFEIAQRTGLEVVIIRSPLVYGSGVKGNFASLIDWAKIGLPLPLGAANNLRSMIALDNLLSFTALCADVDRSPNAKGQVFLISDGEDVSTTELLRRVAKAYGCRSRLFSVPVGLVRLIAQCTGKTSLVNRLFGSLVIDDSKARQMLGWHPPSTMDEQLRKMALYDSRI